MDILPPLLRTAPLRMLWTFLALDLAWSGIVWACSCDLPEPASVRLDASDAVFLGTVERNRSLGCQVFVQSSMDQTETRFTVEEGFKAAAEGDTIEIVHGTSGASCGVVFQEGESWLVFARANEDGRLTTALCDGNNLEGDAQDDLAALRAAE